MESKNIVLVKYIQATSIKIMSQFLIRAFLLSKSVAMARALKNSELPHIVEATILELLTRPLKNHLK